MNREPVDWVNPLIDTANRRYFFFTSAFRPFGMVSLSPDTVPRGAWEGGYRYDVPYICWFGHVHAWQMAGFPVLPTTGPIRGPGIGAYVRWADGPDKPVIVKVALSYCSIDGARLNMETEAPGWDFDAVRADARDDWNRLLGRIRVEGGSEARTGATAT